MQRQPTSNVFGETFIETDPFRGNLAIACDAIKWVFAECVT